MNSLRVSSPVIFVNNKIDALPSTGSDVSTITTTTSADAGVENTDGIPTCFISCITGQGMQSLETALGHALNSILHSDSSGDGETSSGGGGGALITRERHRHHLTACVHHLDKFLSQMLPMDAAAEELR